MGLQIKVMVRRVYDLPVNYCSSRNIAKPVARIVSKLREHANVVALDRIEIEFRQMKEW